MPSPILIQILILILIPIPELTRILVPTLILMTLLLVTIQVRLKRRVLRLFGPRQPVGFGVWGMSLRARGTLDIVDDSCVPKGTKLKAVLEPAAKPAPKAAPKPAPKGKHVQLFKMKRKVGKGFYSVPDNQNERD